MSYQITSLLRAPATVTAAQGFSISCLRLHQAVNGTTSAVASME